MDVLKLAAFFTYLFISKCYNLGIMPIIKTKSGYKYGTTGKVHRSKAKAVKQGQAIRLSQIRRGKRLK